MFAASALFCLFFRALVVAALEILAENIIKVKRERERIVVKKHFQ
jgi:hypothetical protein